MKKNVDNMQSVMYSWRVASKQRSQEQNEKRKQITSTETAQAKNNIKPIA